MVHRFGDLINPLSFRHTSATNFFSIYCYRRLLWAILIVFAGNTPYAQVMLVTFSCTVVLILMGYSYVYREPKQSRLEYFNEFSLIICTYHYYCFTDFVDDPEVRYKVGYSLILVTLINLAVNIFVMLKQTGAKLWLRCKYAIKWFKDLKKRMRRDTEIERERRRDPLYE